GAWVGCIAGALSKGEYEAGLAAVGFVGVSVAFTHQVGDGLHSAIIKATKPPPPARRMGSARRLATLSSHLPPNRCC
ncbi:MAG TPA: hypothetical protein VI751_07650, partial [Actinomycetota bacterium]